MAEESIKSFAAGLSPFSLKLIIASSMHSDDSRSIELAVVESPVDFSSESFGSSSIILSFRN